MQQDGWAKITFEPNTVAFYAVLLLLNDFAFYILQKTIEKVFLMILIFREPWKKKFFKY